MQIYVRVDMEGVTGVVSYEQTNPAGREFSFGTRMLMSDLNALISGVFSHGNHRVVIYDMHFYGRNIDLAAIDPRVEVICGKPYLEDRFFLEGNGFDCLFLLGFHSRAENLIGLLHHSYEEYTKSILVNGKSVGEIGVEAGIAGELKMPLAMVTGDSEGLRETRELLGSDIPSVEVKKSLGETGGLCYPAAETAKRIKEAVPAALERIIRKRPAPFTFPASIKLEISLRKGKVLSKLKKKFPKYFVSSDRILFKGNSLAAAWHDYRTLIGKQ